MFTLGRVISSLVSGFFSLLALLGIAWVVLNAYQYSHILGWCVGIPILFLVLTFLDATHFRKVKDYHILLMKYWGYWDPKNPKIKLWGRQVVTILLGYDGEMINVIPREWSFTAKAFTKGKIEIETRFQIGWQPIFREDSTKPPGEYRRIAAYYEYVADAKKLFPKDPDPEARKMEQFLGGIVADSYQTAIAELDKFEDVQEKKGEIAKAVKGAIETQLGVRDLGIEVMRINPGQPSPSPEYRRTMEQKETERLQREYEVYEKETENSQVERMTTGTGLTGSQAYDRLMLLKSAHPDAYAKIIEAEAKRHIAEAIRDGMGALGKALGEALKGNK